MALVCKPNGGRYWHLNFRFNGKQKTLSIGTYPTVFLSEARHAAENARRLLAQGQDPAAAKQQAKQERQEALLNTFAAVARRWHADNLSRWKPNHAGRIMRYFETDVFPLIGESQDNLDNMLLPEALNNPAICSSSRTRPAGFHPCSRAKKLKKRLSGNAPDSLFTIFR
ncbi:integrase arm-type DNA-binding domain-containing protein [Eikenella sp. HMSC073A11]|uniref:tyrosine-type recombinase/integrase n=1 Tax=Eikenella sp. HMSC073A11 TaxID=1739535 RepID=UPI001FF06A18|nr:integrase arm-type DNA-binding domain-containing protein [Eikenella sp. HMSC073A11]